MFVARAWLVIDDRMSRTRSASGRKADLGMLKTMARTGRKHGWPSPSAPSAVVSSRCDRLKIVSKSIQPPLLGLLCGNTTASESSKQRIDSSMPEPPRVSDGCCARRTSSPPWTDVPSTLWWSPPGVSPPVGLAWFHAAIAGPSSSDADATSPIV